MTPPAPDRSWTAAGRLAAVAICAAAVLLLVVSQAYVVHDRVAFIHPLWPPAVQWAMATGFELSIVSCGLACVVTGFDRWLVYSEAALLIPSLAVAVDVVSPGALPGWVSVSAISAMPIQYVVVVLAGHRLFTHYRQPHETRRATLPREAVAYLGAPLSPPNSETGRTPKRPARPLTNRTVDRSGSTADHLLAYLQERGGSSSVLEVAAAGIVSRASIYRLQDPRIIVSGGQVRLAGPGPA